MAVFAVFGWFIVDRTTVCTVCSMYCNQAYIGFRLLFIHWSSNGTAITSSSSYIDIPCISVKQFQHPIMSNKEVDYEPLIGCAQFKFTNLDKSYNSESIAPEPESALCNKTSTSKSTRSRSQLRCLRRLFRRWLRAKKVCYWKLCLEKKIWACLWGLVITYLRSLICLLM